MFQLATHAFAVTALDYLGNLIQGGCLCVPSEYQLQNDLAGAIRSHGATAIMMTPSIARILDPDQVPSPQNIILVGEPIMKGDI